MNTLKYVSASICVLQDMNLSKVATTDPYVEFSKGTIPKVECPFSTESKTSL